MTTLKKTVLNPETISSISIDFMNNTHFEEIALVQDLGELVLAYARNNNHTDAEREKIDKLVNNWLEHTKDHFSRENELMEKYHYPAYEAHADEHTAAARKMQAVVTAWISDDNVSLLTDYIFHLWPAWFSDHVNSMDLLAAQFAMMNGYSNE